MTGDTFWVGGMFDGRTFEGSIAELRVSDAVRYTATFNPEERLAEDALAQAAWHFDEGTGTSVGSAGGDFSLNQFGAQNLSWSTASCP